jgi:hypothetical protein
MAEVVRFDVRRLGLDYDVPEIAEALEATTGSSDFQFPLEAERFEVELKNVPVGVANAIRRSFYEMSGRSLDFDLTDYDMQVSNALFMTPGFVQGRIRQIPLNPRIHPDVAAALVWKLDMVNPPGSASSIRVYSGDLELAQGKKELHEPLFNVLHPLVVLQPGGRIKIDNIRIKTGDISEKPGYLLSVTRATSVPLDIPEYPKSETHSEKGAARYQSGFKMKSELADPRHFLVSGEAQAVPKDSNVTGKLVLEGCENVLDRLKNVKDIVTRLRKDSGSAIDGGSFFQILPGESSSGDAWYEGTLSIQNETATMGEILSCIALDLYPDVAMASGRYIEHENSMTFILNHPTPDAEGIATMLSKIIEASLVMVEDIRNGIRKFVGAKRPKPAKKAKGSKK